MVVARIISRLLASIQERAPGYHKATLRSPGRSQQEGVLARHCSPTSARIPHRWGTPLKEQSFVDWALYYQCAILKGGEAAHRMIVGGLGRVVRLALEIWQSQVGKWVLKVVLDLAPLDATCVQAKTVGSQEWPFLDKPGVVGCMWLFFSVLPLVTAILQELWDWYLVGQV